MTSSHTATFTVQNTGTCTDTYVFTDSVAGPIGGVSLSQTSHLLAANGSTIVTVTYDVSSAGSGTITLWAKGTLGGASDYGWFTITVSAPAPPHGAPIVDATPYNFDEQDYPMCASGCFAGTATQGTVPYLSFGAARKIDLAYNSDRVSPHPFILLNVRPDTTYGTWPTEYRLQVKVNGTFVPFINGDTTLRFSYPGTTAPVRIGGQIDATTYATNVYGLDILATAYFASTNTLITNDLPTKLVVVNDSGSAVARGWRIGNVQRIYPQSDSSVLIVDGDGSAVYFAHLAGWFVPPAGEFTTVQPSNLSGSAGWVRLYRDSTKAVFNNLGLMTRVLDAFGNRDSVVYDASNRVAKMIDPLNLADSLSYGSTGLSSVRDPGGRVTTVTVDASRRLTAVQDPDNVSTRYGYDASNHLTTITNRGGATTTLAYDAYSGKLDSVKAPQVTFSDSTSGSPISVFGPWQQVGVPYTSTAGSPFAPARADTVRATVTEPGGAVTRFTVDHFGQPVQSIDALGNVFLKVYDSNGLVLKSTYPSGVSDSLAYNTSGLPVFVQAAGRAATHMRYTAFANVDSTWGTGQPTVRRYIGVHGQLDSILVGGTAMTRFTHDILGRVVTGTDPQGNLLGKLTYSTTNGYVVRDSLPGDRVTTYYYDALGRDTAVKVPQMPLSRTSYDMLNRVIKQFDGVHSNPVTRSYDSLFLRSITDVGGQTWTFSHNPLGWTVARTDPGGNVDSMYYDRDGQLRRAKNRRGQYIYNNYDALHRATSRTGSLQVNWSYSTDGRQVTGSGGGTSETRYLNVQGQPDSVSTTIGGQAFWRRYFYQPGGWLDSLSISGGGIAFRSRKYVYDATLGTVDTIRLNHTTTGISNNTNGLPSSFTYPGGDAVSRQYYSLNAPARVIGPTSYNTAVGVFAGFDSLGRITRIINGAANLATAYGYDSLGRVVADSNLFIPSPPSQCQGDPPNGDYGSNCAGSTGWNVSTVQQYSYDSLGNRTDNGGTYTVGDRITQFAGCSYSTDADGNVVSRSICGSNAATFGWLAEGQMSSVSYGGKNLALSYDAFGRLAEETVNGSAHRFFLWDGDDIVAVLDSTGIHELAEYSYFSRDNLHALMTSDSVWYAHSDPTGSVIALTDSAQTVRRQYTFNAFGGVYSCTGCDTYRWKGAFWFGPEVDLYYMRNRWYEPFSGRFLSEDPLGVGAGHSPASLNPYIYASNDPINGADPFGLCDDDNPEDCEDIPPDVLTCIGNADCTDDGAFLLAPVSVEATGGKGVLLDPVIVTATASSPTISRAMSWWYTPTMATGLIDWQVGNQQTFKACTIMDCSAFPKPASPRQLYRCMVSRFWTELNIATDVQAGVEIRGIRTIWAGISYVVTSTATSVATTEAQDRTLDGRWATEDELRHEAIWGLLPGYGTFQSLKQLDAECSR